VIDRTPLEQILKLSLNELSEAVATWIGYVPKVDDDMPWKPTWEMGVRDTDDFASYWPGPPPYASDLNWAAKAEAKLLEVRQEHSYGEMILYLAFQRPGPSEPYHDAFTVLAAATAEVRCQAILLMLAQSVPDPKGETP
jgi:hypothetical protein